VAQVLNPTVAVQLDTKNMKNAIKSLQSFGFDVFHDINGITNDISNELQHMLQRLVIQLMNFGIGGRSRGS
jgi:formyltetrahydrofolate synthetase